MGFDSARPLTADTRPVLGYLWSRDSRYVLYVQDRGGDENFHIWRVDVSAAPDPVTGVPEAVNLTDISGHVETGGQQRPIQLALDAPAFADGMGQSAVIRPH